MPKLAIQAAVIKRTLRSLITITLLVYFGFGLLLYFTQNQILYYPSPEMVNDSHPYTILKSDNETLKVWVLNKGRKDAVIYFGGNAASAGRAIPHLEKMIKDRTVYLVNYRGYGGSSGSPSEQGLSTDALNIYDQFKRRHATISLIGRSIGAGVAIHLAAHRKIHKLALITPFDSIEAVAQNHYPLYPMSLLLKDKYDSISRVSSISAKTLILIAGHDRTVPPEHAHKLADAFRPEQVTVATLAGTTHNTISHHPDYETILKQFLQ